MAGKGKSTSNLEKIKKEMLSKKEKAEKNGREQTSKKEWKNQDRSKEFEKLLQNEELKVVAFKIDETEYGIDIQDVQEINRTSDIIHLPGAPHFIIGMTNLRGECIPVLDLKKRFNHWKEESEILPKLLVLNYNEEKIGIMIDSAKVQVLTRECLEDIPKNFIKNSDESYFKKIAKLDGGKRLLLILNVPKVLSFIGE